MKDDDCDGDEDDNNDHDHNNDDDSDARQDCSWQPEARGSLANCCRDAHRLKESSKTKRRWVLKSAEGLLSLAEFDPDGWDDESVIEVESLDEVESHKAGIERQDSVTQGGVARAKESLRSTANTDLDRARSQSRKKSGKRREKTKSKSARSRKLPKTQDPSTDSKSSK